jgi:hypothetical protein
MQVQQREHLGHLRALAAPWRQDRAGEPHLRAGDRVSPPVVDARGGYRDLTRPGDEHPLPGMAVTPDQAVTVFVHLAGVGGDVGRDLFFQRDRKHPSRAFAHQLIEVPDELGAALGTYYTQHRGVPSSPAVARRRTPACWSSRKVRRALIQQADPQLQVIPPFR